MRKEGTNMEFSETHGVELKGVLNEKVEKEIVAFLNTNNGTIYVGVENDGNVVGIPTSKLDETMKKISDIITDKILPNPQEFVTTSAFMDNGKWIIKIDVLKGNSLYYIKKYGRSATGCYMRIGTTAKSMTEEQIANYFNRYMTKNNKIIDIESREQNLKFQYLKMLYTEKGLSVNDETFENNLKLLTKDNKYNIQANLLADENDTSIKVVVFDGHTKASNIKYRNEYGYKCLIIAMKQAYDYCVDVINTTKTIFESGIRKDIRLFDTDAFRESWYNACLHNDWMDGTPPAVYIFDDHLEIVSTGGLARGLTKQDFFSGISRPVNEVLARIFIQLGLIEQTGHGVSLIVDKYNKDVFEFLDNFIKVKIPFAYNIGEEIQNVPQNVPQKSDLDIIIEIISNNPNATKEEMAKAIGKTTKTVQRIIKESQCIVYVGTSKNGYWEIKK